MEVLKVSSKSNPNSVAGALANAFRERGLVEIQAIGAGALNQAVKAIAIARGYVGGWSRSSQGRTEVAANRAHGTCGGS